MAYDEALALRVRRALADRTNIGETKMFGGICFMLNGNMLCGVDRARLMFRVGKDQAIEALSRAGARPMDITGKPMAGFVFVDPAQCDSRQLKSWIAFAANYVGALPAKKKKKKATKN